MSDITPDKFIGSSLRIRIKDERTLDGILTVIDPFGNILLTNTWETSDDKLDRAKKHVRELGLVSVPRTSIASISIDKKSHRAIFKTPAL